MSMIAISAMGRARLSSSDLISTCCRALSPNGQRRRKAMIFGPGEMASCVGHFCSYAAVMQSAVAPLLGPRDFHSALPFGDGNGVAILTVPAPIRLDHSARRTRFLDHNIRAAGRSHPDFDIGLRQPDALGH